MRYTRGAAAALTAAALGFFAAAAQAADSLSFGDQGPSASFGANAVVRIDGSITYESHCAKPGINDFFYPATDVYVVPTGEGTGTLHDASGGGPNTIVSSATAFTDEVIALTAPGGNLDDGDYDVVFDTCQDGTYDPGVDTIFPHAITVEEPYVAPLADDGIKAIKNESRQEYESWMQTRQMMSAIFKLADQAIKTQCKAGNPVGCVMKKVDYFGGVKERFLALLLSQANHYQGIADDPPDANFDKPTTIAPFENPSDHSESAFGNALADSLRPLAGEAALNGALLHAIERYQGAQVAGDRTWALVHAREARDLTEALRAIAPATSDALGDLRGAVSGAGFDDALSAGRTFAARVRSTGFSGDERRSLRNEGTPASQIAKLETDVRDLVQEDPIADTAPLLAALDQARSAHAATVSALATSAGKWDAIVKAIEATPGGPAAIDAGGPYTATEGTALTLAGSGSGDAAWDLDADGEFDDATGFKPSVTFARAGAYVIGVKAGDAVAYAVVRVADANRAPVLSAAVPADRMATITVGSALALSVSATDPDSDPIDYSWTIDGAAADGHGATLTFSPTAAQVGSHTIEVTASDGSNTTRRSWDLAVVDRDADEDGWTKTTDCDETDPAVHPTANELLGNGVDDDCDAGTPDAPPGGLTGSMMSWGSNHNGTIGSGSFQPTLVASPVAIPGLDNVVQVDGGDRSGYALLANGEVRAWGFNGSGNLGDGTQYTPSATPVSPSAVGGGSGRLSGVTQLASDTHGTVLARRSDGTVVAWGSNQQHEVGDGSTVASRLYPVQVLTGPDGPPLQGVRSVEGGYADSYAVMEDGTVRAWGQIRCDGGTNIRIEPFPVALPMAGNNVRQVASGDKMTLILKKDGTVLECGHVPPVAGRPVTTEDMYVPKPVTGFGPGSGVIDVAANDEGGLALKADGSVWTWGANNNWELGVLGYNGSASVPAPVQVPLPSGPPVVDVDMDNACHALLTRADGSVLGYGCDYFEQVGNGEGPGSGVTTPTVISMPGRSTFGISAAGWNSLALTRPVADDWKAPATWVRASVADATVGEAGGGKIKISLSAALPHDVTVDWSAEAGTAGSDDVNLDSHTATVPAGATSVEVDAPVRDDALDEDDETFTVALSDASNGVQLDRSQATVTISDDDAPPSVGVRPAAVAEGDTSLTDVPVKVRLSGASGKPVSVAFATADGTAVSPADYAPASGRLVIASGAVEGVVHVAVRGDAAVEPDEALSVSLSDPSNATLDDASAPLTISDDEPLVIGVASPSVTEGNSSTTPATFTVSLEQAPPAGSSVSADYHVAGVTAGVPGDVAAASGTLTFAAGEKVKQVTVQVQGDTEDEGDEAFRLALSNLQATGGRPVLRGESSVATIVDDDDAAPPPPPSDTTAPVTTATPEPAPNAAGWHRQNVTVKLAATDDGGSGVKELSYTVAGVSKTVAGASASIPVTAEGATTIAYSAKDNAGNAEAEQTFVVRIDKTAPTVSCSASPGTLWPADHRLVPITVKVKVTDGRSGPAGFTLTSVTSNEPDDAPGSGDGATTGDIRDFDPGTADVAGQLRAERADAGRGRTYTLTYVGRDAAGNERTCTTTVSVPKTCTGTHAAQAEREVQLARREDAAR